MFVSRYQRVFNIACAINAACFNVTEIKLPKAPHSAQRCMTFAEVKGKCTSLIAEFDVSKASTLSHMGRFQTSAIIL